MDEPPPVATRARPFSWVNRLAIVLFLFLAFAVCFVDVVPKDNREGAEARNSAILLLTSLRAYEIEFGPMPAGDHADIIAALGGQNPGQIVFLDLSERKLSATGEFLDPWGAPYHFDLTDPDTPHIWSAGPDAKDDNGAKGSDDIVTWR